MMTTEKPPAEQTDAETEPETEPAPENEPAELDEHPAPPPGHPAALASGCICPVWLNGYGDGLLSTVGAPPEAGVYLQHPECRLHGTL